MSTPGRHSHPENKELYNSSPKKTGHQVNLLGSQDDEFAGAAQTRGKQQPGRCAGCWSMRPAAAGPRIDNLFQPIANSKPNARRLPAELRDPKGNWFALTRPGSG